MLVVEGVALAGFALLEENNDNDDQDDDEQHRHTNYNPHPQRDGAWRVHITVGYRGD